MRIPNTLSIVLVAILTGCGRGPAPTVIGPSSPLFSPTGPEMTTVAPATFNLLFETTKGDFVLEVNRDWAPLGADRFYNLARFGFFDGAGFFRVIPGFVVQFGLPADPALSEVWRGHALQDDPLRETNARGTVSYAMTGPDSRTTQIFINLGENSRLDASGFTPFARVSRGMEVVEQLYSGYGEGAPRGPGPDQIRIMQEGSAYLEQVFPRLDFIRRVRVLPN